jgi:hypothetical protein
MNAEGIIWDALRGALVTRALGLAADLRVAQALSAGGRERTAEQWQLLLGDAGWRATRVGEGVIEAQPA